MELADRALRNPVLGLAFIVLLDLLFVGMLGDFAVLVFDGTLVLFTILLLCAAAFDEARVLWPLTVSSHMFVAAGNGQGVVVSPFDTDVLLLDAG